MINYTDVKKSRLSGLVVADSTNADTLDLRHAGHGNNQIPISDSTLNTNLNSDLLDGMHASGFAAVSHSHDGTDITSIVSNANTLDGTHSSGFAASTHSHANYQDTSAKGQSSGYASLDSLGKIPTGQLPGLALTDVYAVSDETSQLALNTSTQEGDVCIRSDLNKSYVRNDGTAGTMADQSELLTPTDVVISVNGNIGAVNITASDMSFTPYGDITSETVQNAIQELNDDKAATGHDHNSAYYTETEIDTKLQNQIGFKSGFNLSAKDTTSFTVSNGYLYIEDGTTSKMCKLVSPTDVTISSIQANAIYGIYAGLPVDGNDVTAFYDANIASNGPVYETGRLAQYLMIIGRRQKRCIGFLRTDANADIVAFAQTHGEYIVLEQGMFSPNISNWLCINAQRNAIHDYRNLSDHGYSCTTGIANIASGVASSFGKLLSMDGSTFVLADADTTNTVPAIYMAAEDGTGEKMVLIPPGYVRDDSQSFTAGSMLYASSTAGEITQTKPSTSGKQVQIIGVAITATKIYFNPSPVVVEIA